MKQHKSNVTLIPSLWGKGQGGRGFFFLPLLFLLFPLAVFAQGGLASQLDALIKQKLPKGSDVGISVFDLTAGKPLYSYRASKLSRPASTMKLLTTITALSRPDADEPFRTEVWYNGVIERDTLQGDIYVIGGFDPEFDDKGMNALVEGVASFPFSVVNGTVYGDVSMKDSLYFGSGWIWDDNPYAFQPYLSPLMYNKGAVTLTVSPGSRVGEAARVKCSPISSFYTVDNRTETRTPSAGKLIVTREWMDNRNMIIVSGNVDGWRKDGVNLFTSQDFFMYTFLERLHAKGIEVTSGYAFSGFSKGENSVRMAVWSCPVEDVVKQIMKESDNLNAEALLCRLGAQATGKKHVSARDGIAEIEKLMRCLGHNPDNYKIADGCGLSNYDYLSPALLVDFLKYAYAQPGIYRKLYKALPVAGVDGTLKNRMKQGKAYNNVHAKTGSYTGINSLAGYLKDARGHLIAFAIMNQNVMSGAKARELQDKICEVMVNGK